MSELTNNRSRNRFTLVTSHALTITHLTPAKVERVAFKYASGKTFTVTVTHTPLGDDNASSELDQSVSSVTSIVWAPSNLIVHKDDILTFTNDIADPCEVTVQFNVA